MMSFRKASQTSIVIRAIDELRRKLLKETVDTATPPTSSTVSTCQDLMGTLDAQIRDYSGKLIPVLEETNVGKALTKASKVFKRHSRTEVDDQWKVLNDQCSSLLSYCKKRADEEAVATAAAEKKKKMKEKQASNTTGYPSNVDEYRCRLIKQNKEMYKDPPAMPPPKINCFQTYQPLPKRMKNGDIVFDDYKTFRPNVTPEEVLRAGSFGGTYFRSIVSAITNQSYKADEVLKDTVPDEWIKGLSRKVYLTSQSYKPQVNKFGVKCGGSLGMWASSGWISDVDPYGWFQWYCRFYQGRRTSDDQRQIDRWAKSAGPKGRFKSQLCNKVIAANTRADDASISPVIRQTLLHWGFQITTEIVEAHRRKK